MYGLVRSVSKFFKMGMYDYCNLESVDCISTKETEEDSEDKIVESDVFVTKDGGLLSVIEVAGTLSIVGTKRFEDQLDQLIDNLSGALSEQGYRLQFVFTRDPEISDRPLAPSINAIKKTVKTLQLDIEDMIEEREKILTKKTCYEKCYLIVTTLPSKLPPATVKQAMKDRLDSVKNLKVGIKPGEFGQSPFIALSALRETHIGMVNSIKDVLSETLVLKVLDVHAALNAVKQEINPIQTSPDWYPSLIGDKIKPRAVKESGYERDVSHVMHPDIAFQLFSQEPKVCEEDPSIVQVGQRFMAPLLVDIPPQSPKPFANLFNRIKPNVPYRWSFTLETGHEKTLGKIGTKHTFASFLAFSNGDNKLIKEAAEELMEIGKEEVLVTAYMNICTWGNDLKETRKRKSLINASMQNWGKMDVIEETGDAVEAWCSSLPAFSAKQISTGFPIPLLEAMVMTPLIRPTSAWDSGSILFRTIDNKLYPMMLGSSLQTTWVDLVFAPPGYGKSFYLSASNMALITKPGNRILPRISIIDIGFSSASFVDMIKEALPSHLKYLAQSYKLQMTSDYAINVFDTPLACEYPLSIDRDFLVNFVTLVLTPAGIKDSIPRLTELVGALIDAMYEAKSSAKDPEPYSPRVDDVVDLALENEGIHVHDETTWYEIVYELYEKGLYLEAGLAQRYAVPTLNDATAVLTADVNIKDTFGNARVGDEDLISFAKGMIISATKEYPILSGVSVFDIGSARICSMDLSAVAKSGSPQADKKTGIMYMLARQVMCRDFYIGEDNVNEIPAKYRGFHKKKIDDDSEVPKKLCMDEFHRTKNSPSVRAQSVIDIREGRKYDVHVALLSQMVDDFDDAMVELATNVYILSKGIAEDTITKIKKIFNPSSDAIKGLRQYVTGPTKEGSSMLYLGALKGGKGIEQVIRLTLGSVEIWAYSTTKEDVILRKIMTEKIGLNNALRILAVEFPGGTAKSYIESKSLSEEEEVDESIYETIKNELIDKHRSLISI
jgi:intracellular multiplication protein IcmB